VIEIVMKEDKSKGAGLVIWVLVGSLIFLPWDLKWATLAMIVAAVLIRLIIPGRGSEAAFLVLLGYAIFGNLGARCWWLVIPFILICYIADRLKAQQIENQLAGGSSRR
jgi:uncharacterized membrane protein